MKVLYKVFLPICITSTLFMYGCSSDTDNTEEEEATSVVLSTYTGTTDSIEYKEINTFDDAALAGSAMSFYAKTAGNRDIANSIKEEVIEDITKDDYVYNDTIHCDDGYIIVRIDTTITGGREDAPRDRTVSKNYRDCHQGSNSKNGNIEASWHYNEEDQNESVILEPESFHNTEINLDIYADKLYYNILDNEDDYDFSIDEDGYSFVVNSDYKEKYHGFSATYKDNHLSINGIIVKYDDNCKDGNYLVKTIDPIIHYGYDDTEIQGTISVNDVIYKFNDDETLTITLKNGESKTENARAFMNARCPSSPPERRER